MLICSITKDQGKLLGPTPTRKRVSLLKQVRISIEEIKFTILTERNATADFS
jgi:hypothetical protein